MLEIRPRRGPAPIGQTASPAAVRTFAVTPSASFLATTRMAINAGRTQGMQVGNGADMVLRRGAEAEGKTVEGLETLQAQIDDVQPDAGDAGRRACRAPAQRGARPRSGAKPVEVMAEMQSAWKRGDQSVFVRILGQLEQASPDTYRMMFTERNARWADWIRGAACKRREPCSSRSAPAISRARTACSSACPARHPIAPRKLERANLLF